MNIWQEYEVRLDFLNEVCGSTPGDPEALAATLRVRAPKVKPPDCKTITEIQEEVIATLPDQPEEELAASQLVFQRVDGALSFRSSTFRST